MTEIINPTESHEQDTQRKVSESEKRIKELSEKVELTSKERDEKDNLIKEGTKKIAELEKENSFHSQFSDMLSAHPNAKTHKDAIKEKVMSGYSVEDATFAVLGKAGALGGTQVEPTNPAGGSADTAMNQTGNKSVSEMTQEERRAILAKELILE